MSTRAADGFNWRLIIGFWLLIAILLIARNLAGAGTTPLYGDTDDAMRIVTATDLLSGQGWLDHSEIRDNTPYGAQMHWSRLVDAPIAGLIWLARPLAGMDAPDVAARLWPVLLLLPLMIVSVGLTRVLVPGADPITALALPVLSLVLLAEFSPGRVDHHNVQIVLTLAMVLALIESRNRPLAALGAGALAGTSLAIGMETLPFVVVAVVSYGVLWAIAPARHERAVRWFSLSVALVTLGQFLLAVPPSLYLAPVCDVISMAYVIGAAAAGLALATATYVGAKLPTTWARLLLVAALGALAGAAALALYPACIAGPYGQVNPVIYDTLFPAILEAQPLWVQFSNAPITAIGFSAVPMIALALLVWICLRMSGEERQNWLILLAFLLVAVAIMMLQNRGARIASALSIPVGAWIISLARQRYVARQTLRAGALLLGSWLLFASAIQWVTLDYAANFLQRAEAAPTPGPAAAATQEQSQNGCFMGSSYQELAGLPVARVVAPLRIGPYVLRYTPHSLVSAGFHRNTDGTLDVLRFFSQSEADARAIVAKRGLQYLVVCDGLAEFGGAGGVAQGSFTDLYRKGQLWDWLEPVSPATSGLAIYRFIPTKVGALN